MNLKLWPQDQMTTKNPQIEILRTGNLPGLSMGILQGTKKLLQSMRAV